jgi:hypothetical protein
MEPFCQYGLLTHFWFLDVVIQMSFDQIVFGQKMLDHLANSVHIETFSLLLTNWLRFVYFVQNEWSHFADTVCQHTFGFLALSSKCLLPKRQRTKKMTLNHLANSVYKEYYKLLLIN